MQLSGALSGPGSKVPTGGDPKLIITVEGASSRVIFKTTDAISSVFRTFITNSDGAFHNQLPSPSGSQTYPVNVNTGFPSISPNTS
jgi:hypothetical protein